MIIGILIGVIIVLLAYIYKFKKEVSNISKQLQEYNYFKTEKKIDVEVLNRELEELGKSINENIEIFNKIKVDERKGKEELKTMISNISHDIRTPLTSILGYIQMLEKRGLESEKSKEYLNKVSSRARDLQGLLEEFFLLSVLEEDNYKIELSKVDVGEILKEVLIDFYDEFEEKGIEPIINIEEEALALGSGKEIKRILENLLKNSLKHSKGKISISLEKGKKIKLIVSNPIEEKIQVEKIFNRLYKEKDKSRGEKNTGLGLSIVKVLMEKMEGEAIAKIEKNKIYIICIWESA